MRPSWKHTPIVPEVPVSLVLSAPPPESKILLPKAEFFLFLRHSLKSEVPLTCHFQLSLCAFS